MCALICTVHFILVLGILIWICGWWWCAVTSIFVQFPFFRNQRGGFFARCIPSARSRLQAEMKMQNSKAWCSVPNPSLSFDVSGKTWKLSVEHW